MSVLRDHRRNHPFALGSDVKLTGLRHNLNVNLRHHPDIPDSLPASVYSNIPTQINTLRYKRKYDQNIITQRGSNHPIIGHFSRHNGVNGRFGTSLQSAVTIGDTPRLDARRGFGRFVKQKNVHVSPRGANPKLVNPKA